ncbi:PREDICTED: zeatin O-glucosyltransferase-like [Nicotiana attenuata]|uniref:zeatin O-glucosyltransferase-like n=1 Tax=Nicotiana attenuata TaxID=49451 RepID=UPI000905B084|nr:PREDICTED: zeatin O-glucosyltransferase-like [Nicotiana attenuata]
MSDMQKGLVPTILELLPDSFTVYSASRQIVNVVDEDHDKMITQLDEFPRVKNCFGSDIVEFVKKEREPNPNTGEFMNFSRELEGKCIDLLANVRSKPLSQELVNELALGLVQSDHKFIWVLREADRKIDSEKCEGQDGKFKLPKGFEEKMEGKGMVVRNWVPQLKILGHKSIGGFLSHYGWNSCKESVSTGVPIATWPIHVDQPYNAVFVTNVLKIGTSVRSWACREELVTSKAVEKAVNTLMGTPEAEADPRFDS